jgi:outer membrane lipoprotein carrier protein
MTPVEPNVKPWGPAGALVLMLLAAPVQAEDAGVGKVMARMESFYRDSPGITADFTQILESRTLGRPQQESGTLFLKPPGRMRWEYQTPRGKLAVTDGIHAYLYLPEDRQAIVGRISDMDTGAVASRLLMGAAPLSRDFQVEGEPSPADPGVWLLKLTPRSGDFPYDAVTLEVAAASGAIRCIRLLDPLGNRMEYRFEHIRVVPDLADRIFTYKIPRGVDVQIMGEGSKGPLSP